MAAPAAATKAAAVLDDGVADLAGGAGGAAPERAINEDGATNAGADEDADEARAAARGAKALLTIGANLDIVAEHDGEVEAAGEQIADGHVNDTAGEVGRAQQQAARTIHLAGEAEADGRNFAVAVQLGVVECGGGHVLQALGEEVRATLRVGALAGGGDDLAGGEVDDAGVDLGAADINAEGVFRCHTAFFPALPDMVGDSSCVTPPHIQADWMALISGGGSARLSARGGS